MKILSLCGSLRTGSSNLQLLSAAANVAPAGLRLVPFTGLAAMPAFNPDHDLAGSAPLAVTAFRAGLTAADGVLIASPEYAHGVPGGLKNALDWVVGNGEFVGKPVAVICGGEVAPAQLAEILRVMSWKLVRIDAMRGPVLRRAFAADGTLHDPEVATILRACVEALAAAVRAGEGPASR